MLKMKVDGSAIKIYCEGCGQQFEKKRPWQRFCAIKCHNKFHNYQQGLAMKQFKENQK